MASEDIVDSLRMMADRMEETSLYLYCSVLDQAITEIRRLREELHDATHA